MEVYSKNSRVLWTTYSKSKMMAQRYSPRIIGILNSERLFTCHGMPAQPGCYCPQTLKMLSLTWSMRPRSLFPKVRQMPWESGMPSRFCSKIIAKIHTASTCPHRRVTEFPAPHWTVGKTFPLLFTRGVGRYLTGWQNIASSPKSRTSSRGENNTTHISADAWNPHPGSGTQTNINAAVPKYFGAAAFCFAIPASHTLETPASNSTLTSKSIIDFRHGRYIILRLHKQPCIFHVKMPAKHAFIRFHQPTERRRNGDHLQDAEAAYLKPWGK